MLEQHIQVSRSARYYVLGTPQPDTNDVWIVCHGFAQLASRFLRRFEPAQVISRLIVAPEALNRFYIDTSPRPHGPDAVIGATWMTREDRSNEIRDYVRYLDAVHDEVMQTVDRSRVRLLVLGFSQGTATVCRWISMGKVRPDHLVLWSGNIPADLELPDSRGPWLDLSVTTVRGSEDAGVNRMTIAADRDRLLRAGAKWEMVEFDGGHEMHAATLLGLDKTQ